MKKLSSLFLSSGLGGWNFNRRLCFWRGISFIYFMVKMSGSPALKEGQPAQERMGALEVESHGSNPASSPQGLRPRASH